MRPAYHLALLQRPHADHRHRQRSDAKYVPVCSAIRSTRERVHFRNLTKNTDNSGIFGLCTPKQSVCTPLHTPEIEKSNCIGVYAAMQKCFTVDFLTKKRKVNEGEVPQYYVEHSHEPIITPEEFDKVQTELARRKRISRQYSGKSIFSSRIVCGDCGSYFGSKVWNSTSKYRRVIWQCNSKFKGEHKCETPHLNEETIKARFVTALNAIIDSKDGILEDCRLMQTTLTDCTGIDAEIESLLEEIDVVTELTKRCIAENSQTAQNQEEYAVRYNGFVERYEKAKAQLEQLRTTKAEWETQAEAIGAFMFEMQELDTITEFDEKLWLTTIDAVTVHADGRMTFKFQGGTEIEG